MKTLLLFAVVIWLPVSGRETAPTVEESVKPGINRPYLDAELKVDDWLKRFEVESREVFHGRKAILKACAIKPGMRVADIGAGTGLYSLMFADAVGPAGAVFAVDIEPRFLKLIGQRAADLDLGNVVSVLGRDTDITLPHASVDVVFIADTYHYFSDRAAIMATVRDALVDGGRLVILDYTLDESHKGDPKRAHVRFGKAGLISEIESYGFRLADEPDVPGLSEIYMVVFEKA